MLCVNKRVLASLLAVVSALPFRRPSSANFSPVDTLELRSVGNFDGIVEDVISVVVQFLKDVHGSSEHCFDECHARRWSGGLGPSPRVGWRSGEFAQAYEGLVPLAVDLARRELVLDVAVRLHEMLHLFTHGSDFFETLAVNIELFERPVFAHEVQHQVVLSLLQVESLVRSHDFVAQFCSNLGHIELLILRVIDPSGLHFAQELGLVAIFEFGFPLVDLLLRERHVIVVRLAPVSATPTTVHHVHVLSDRAEEVIISAAIELAANAAKQLLQLSFLFIAQLVFLQLGEHAESALGLRFDSFGAIVFMRN